MTERDFIAAIDCRFPYDNPLRWRRLASLAPRISANAAFMILYEVCCPPRGRRPSRQQAEAVRRHLETRFRHPLLRLIQPVICAHLSGHRLPEATVARIIRKVAMHRDQYTALALCELAARGRSGHLQSLGERIRENWWAARRNGGG